MTVQFILPEATSFPKERKLHDRLFLVLLYNLLCKTFKDHSSTFAASSRIRAHPSLARALLPDCECKGRAFLHSLQDFDEKKMREKFICAHFATSSHCKIGSKARFFASSPPCDFLPQTALFRPIRPLWGQKPPFSGCFSLQFARNSRPKSHFAPKKSV